MTLPLGLKKDPRNPALIEKLLELETYDFREINQSVQTKYNWTQEKTEHYEREAKKFFALAFLDAGAYHIPEADVDEYWHRMILHTKFYNEFCQKIFGTYYHHTPEPDETLVSEENRRRSLALIPYWFGTEWGTLVRTCTQCRGPFLSTSLRPAAETLPGF